MAPIAVRVPGLDEVPVETAAVAVRPEPGEPIPGPGLPSAITAAWPWFRGPDRDAFITLLERSLTRHQVAVRHSLKQRAKQIPGV